MSFGHSDSESEGEQMATGYNGQKAKLKRRWRPADADQAESQDPRKLPKLNSVIPALASNRKTERPKPGPSPTPDADDNCLRIAGPLSPQKLHERTSLSSESTFPALSITDDTPLEHRTAFIEAHNAPTELHSDTFQHFAELRFYSALHFEVKRAPKMSNSELAACFDLISKTSQQDYKSSSRGWDPDYKMEEMTHPEMMYLLIRQVAGYTGVDKTSEPDSSADHVGAILGFLSFKLEPEEEELNMMRPVLYIYEVHIDDRLRNQGLGRRMIEWIEGQARLVKISKIMLTVFTVNEGARRVYERAGFVKDELSPSNRVTRRKVIKADYIIMSKEL